MYDIDEKLIILKAHLVEGILKKEETAAVLNISNRQLGRLLKKWEDEGILNYNPGSGRGNNSTVTFNIDIEHIYVYKILKEISDFTKDQINEVLHLPLTDESKAAIRSYAKHLLNSPPVYHEMGHTYDVYLPEINTFFHPLQELNDYSKLIVTNVFETLYKIDKYGNLSLNLVIYDEWNENTLNIHLNNQIRFSDGTPLCAIDVLENLITLKEHPEFKEYFSDIVNIKAGSLFILEIEMEQKDDHIKERLARYPASVYRETDKGLMGTGAYYIENTEKRCVLKRNQYFLGKVPDISEVVINEGTHPNDNTIHFKYIEWLMIAFSTNHSKLDEFSRALIIDYIMARIEGLEVTNQELYHQLSFVILEQPLIITVVNEDETKRNIIDYLHELNIPMKVIPISLSQFLMININDYKTDMIIKDEILPEHLGKEFLLNKPCVFNWFNLENNIKIRELMEQGSTTLERFSSRLQQEHWLTLLRKNVLTYYFPEHVKYAELTVMGTVDISSVIIN